jgi:dTDP-4-dehydrorhamnose reductase
LRRFIMAGTEKNRQMKVMITGGNGFLGQHLCRFLKDFYQVSATGKGERRIPFNEVEYIQADIADDMMIGEVARIAPDVIIHTAAMSKPDECNNNKALCNRVNIEGTEMIIRAAQRLRKAPHVIYTSSDFVLGEGGPHDETAIPSPLNYYGETKLKAEKIVEESSLLYTIVRPVFMYGEAWDGIRSTFLHWVKKNLEDRKEIKVVCDQQRTPSYVVDICKGIRSVMERKAGGLYHLAGVEVMTPYDMAIQFATLMRLDGSLIEPVTAETFKEPVIRARQGGLLINKAVQELGYSPTRYSDGVRLSFPSHT